MTAAERSLSGYVLDANRNASRERSIGNWLRRRGSDLPHREWPCFSRKVE